MTVQNLATTAQTFNATLTVINSAILPLSSTNLVVARVGDGAQPLSGATGNTLYLDQYTPPEATSTPSRCPTKEPVKLIAPAAASATACRPAALH